MWWIVVIVVVIILLLLVAIGFGARSAPRRDDDNHSINLPRVSNKELEPTFIPANDLAGMWGEEIVSNQLKSLLKRDEYLLTNLLIPLSNGHKTEIDCVLISRKGIFCVETKNWMGHISGNNDDEYWYQEYDDVSLPTKRHKNPVKQNEAHCEALERILNTTLTVDNAVIFADLEDESGIKSDFAFSVDSFIEFYNGLNDDYIFPNELEPLYRKLLCYVATEKELEKHRRDVKRQYGDQDNWINYN